MRVAGVLRLSNGGSCPGSVHDSAGRPLVTNTQPKHAHGTRPLRLTSKAASLHTILSAYYCKLITVNLFIPPTHLGRPKHAHGPLSLHVLVLEDVCIGHIGVQQPVCVLCDMFRCYALHNKGGWVCDQIWFSCVLCGMIRWLGGMQFEAVQSAIKSQPKPGQTAPIPRSSRGQPHSKSSQTPVKPGSNSQPQAHEYEQAQGLPLQQFFDSTAGKFKTETG